MKTKNGELNFFGTDGNPADRRGREHEKNWVRRLGIALLLFSIGFNLWIYRMEPTAKVDPNDNHFQYALVDRTNQIWDFALKKFSFFYLFDHWVPNWAEGYNLPYYYSHIPQIIIVTSWRLLHLGTLFQYYHYVIYLLLSFFPLSMFIALRVMGMRWMTAGFGALIASQISTDGFYGLDPASFLWRGYGLSSQLFAMVWLPLAIAYAYRGKTIPAILMLAATTAGHLGIGIMAFISVGIIALRKAFWIWAGAFLLLAYWIVPAYINNAYHNFSVWDPMWKFDSYGATEVLTRLLNGNLFDFGHFPVLTILIFIGLFTGKNFSLLFAFWLLMYFGRTTWGGLMDLIPFIGEFHQSRFIVGIHLAGLFLIPIVIEKMRSLAVFVVLVVLVVFAATPQTLRYAQYNDFLIQRGNADYEKVKDDVDSLISNLSTLISTRPGRVFAGRGGGWGKDFRVAETPYFMHLSTYGIPTVLWMPETWSPNSDTEQFFSEDKAEDYDLYNIRYVVTPPTLLPQPFWKLLKEASSWRLYRVDLGSLGDVSDLGYITTGVRPAVVSSSKENFFNLIHLWIQSDYPKQGLFPQLVLSDQLAQSSLPHFQMLDEVTYTTPDNKTHSLFSEIPLYSSPSSPSSLMSLSSQSSDSDMVFRATVEVKPGCTECLVILKQTYHPSWKVTIDGKPAEKMIVFPFYIAVSIPEGSHEVIFSYHPSPLKIVLLILSLISLSTLITLSTRF